MIYRKETICLLSKKLKSSRCAPVSIYIRCMPKYAHTYYIHRYMGGPHLLSSDPRG